MSGAKKGFGKRGNVAMPSHGVPPPSAPAPEPNSPMMAWAIGAVAAIGLAGLVASSGAIGGGGFLGGFLGGMLANKLMNDPNKTAANAAQQKPTTANPQTGSNPAQVSTTTRSGFGTTVSRTSGGGWFGG